MPETVTFIVIFDAKHYLKVATYDKNTKFALTLEIRTGAVMTTIHTPGVT